MKAPEEIALIGGGILLSSGLVFGVKSGAASVLPTMESKISNISYKNSTIPSSNNSKQDSTSKTIHVHFSKHWEIGNTDLGERDISIKQGDHINMNSITPTGYAGFFAGNQHLDNDKANYSYNEILNKIDSNNNLNYFVTSTTPNMIPLGIEYWHNDSVISEGTAYFNLNAISSSDQLDVSKQVPIPNGYHLDKSANLGETSNYPYASGGDISDSYQLIYLAHESKLGNEYSIAPN